MADAGIGEAALLAAAAESAAAAGGTAAAVAAAEAAATAAAAGATAAGTAAAAAPAVEAAIAAPTLALAAPEVAAATVPTAAEAAASLAPTAAEPIFLGGTTSEPLLGSGVIEGGVWDSTAPTTGLLGDTGAAGTWEGPATLQVSDVSAPGVLDTGTWSEAGSKGLLDKAAAWWDKATLGEKLKAGGTLASGVSTAAKAATPSTPSSGPKTTIRPGTTGKPMGGEQTLAQVVEALLKRRDAYTGAQYGVPVAYRPRGLLG
jgi:hypothetical protein